MGAGGRGQAGGGEALSELPNCYRCKETPCKCADGVTLLFGSVAASQVIDLGAVPANLVQLFHARPETFPPFYELFWSAKLFLTIGRCAQLNKPLNEYPWKARLFSTRTTPVVRQSNKCTVAKRLAHHGGRSIAQHPASFTCCQQGFLFPSGMFPNKPSSELVVVPGLRSSQFHNEVRLSFFDTKIWQQLCGERSGHLVRAIKRMEGPTVLATRWLFQMKASTASYLMKQCGNFWSYLLQAYPLTVRGIVGISRHSLAIGRSSNHKTAVRIDGAG